MKYLKEVSKDVKYNKEVVNTSKEILLDKYRQYLINKKNDIETGMNPLKPESVEDKTSVINIMKNSYYTKSDSLKLKRKGKSFYWVLSLDNVDGIFENETLRMRELVINNISSSDKIIMDEYILMNGKNEFPRLFTLISNDLQYDIKVSRIYHFDSRDRSIRKRYNEYMKKNRKGIFILKEVNHPLL
jgi:hypothetical protein